MEKGTKTPEWRLEANKRYLSKFADIKLRILPEFRNEIQQHSAAMGESMSQFIKRAIIETMERDRGKKKG